jgi:hypothetical protein
MSIVWNRVTWYSKLLALIVVIGVFGLGLYLGALYDQAEHPAVVEAPGLPAVAATSTASAPSTAVSNTPPAQTAVSHPASSASTQTPPASAAPASTPTSTADTIPSGETRFVAYLTAYTYWDNTPPGSSEISNPIIHTLAGGTGTYSDPITVAVGHSITGNVDTLDYPAGTKFYVPNLRKYFIVEDTCGDGSTPQNGPCHTGYEGHPWLDLWLDGSNGTKATSDACANAITDLHLIIEDPAPGYAVNPGALYNNGCSSQYGDTVVSA